MNPTTKSLDLIHYGTDAFVPDAIDSIQDRGWIKPYGGFWASPIDSTYGWKDWCIANDYCLHRLKKSIRLRFVGVVLTIDSERDLELLDWYVPSRTSPAKAIRFRTLVDAGVDAVHLTARGERETRWSRPNSLYGWDCESVLILNPDCLSLIYRDAVPPVPLILPDEQATYMEKEHGWIEGKHFIRSKPLPTE